MQKSSLTSFFGLSYFFLIAITSLAQSNQNLSSCERARLALQQLEHRHIKPRLINEKFFEELTEEFYSSIDPYGLYFTSTDIHSDSIGVSSLFRPGNSNECNWKKASTKLINRKLNEAQKIVTSILSVPFHFDKIEFLEQTNLKKETFSHTPAEQRKKWEAYLKYKTLKKMYQLNQAESSVSDFKKMALNEKIARDAVLKRETKRARTLNSKIEKQIDEVLLKSLAHSFDPHSEYFSTSEMTAFEESLSTTENSFGLQLTENILGEVSVSRILPGGSAWKSNEIHSGDVLVGAKNADGDFSEIDASDFVIWKENTIELRIKKTDGTISEVKLVKEKIESIENRVQGFTLNGNKKIGYVSLPSFYHEWGDPSGVEGCANDLAKEIVKLKKEGIAGLILDLRFNGGGSLLEAIDLTGIFIDIGPVAIVKTKQGLTILKDKNRGQVYDGPLLILVNGMSASASEFLAATLQDYNRAIIVGTPTYGKGTGQQVFRDSTTTGFIKITIEQLYRISGRTNQKKGVIPNVILPDLTQEFVDKEEDAPNSLPADSIQKKMYYSPYPAVSFDKIKTSSSQRISGSKWFSALDSAVRFYQSNIPLELHAFLKYKKQGDRFIKTLNENEITSNFKVAHNQFDNSVLKVDSFLKSTSEESLHQIAKSAYINEAYLILNDYINQIKK